MYFSTIFSNKISSRYNILCSKHNICSIIGSFRKYLQQIPAVYLLKFSIFCEFPGIYPSNCKHNYIFLHYFPFSSVRKKTAPHMAGLPGPLIERVALADIGNGCLDFIGGASKVLGC